MCNLNSGVYQPYHHIIRTGTRMIADTSTSVLHAGNKYANRGTKHIPTTQNRNEPIPIHERYFSVVNSIAITKLALFRKPMEKVH